MNQLLGFQQKMTQSLVLTPQMLQTLKIIQYSTTELLEHIQHEVADNPFLSEDLEHSNNVALDKLKNEDAQDYYLEYQDYQAEGRAPANNVRMEVDKTSLIEKTTANTEQLSHVLLDQLRFYYPKGTRAMR